MFTLVNLDGEQNLTVYVPGGSPLAAHESHPNFKAIVAAITSDEDATVDEIESLFDVGKAVATRFQTLSERVSVANGCVYFDGDEVDDSLTKAIVRFLDEDVDDWKPLVAFMENVASNPNDHSRTQLYDWLNAHDFSITEDGLIVGYKGVNKQPDGSLVSGWTGKAIVDGVPVEGQIPNAVGSTVEMPRSSVQHDPSAACSVGLHVGTFAYARGYARGAMLRVSVNPRDVVSVPTDAHGEKVRVCRYTVEEIIDAPVSSALYRDPDSLDFEDEDDEGQDAGEFRVGDRVEDYDGDEGTIIDGPDEDGDYRVEYDNENYGIDWLSATDLSRV
jgi:hypothetical protein